jgi:hypothetical protein
MGCDQGLWSVADSKVTWRLAATRAASKAENWAYHLAASKAVPTVDSMAASKDSNWVTKGCGRAAIRGRLASRRRTGLTRGLRGRNRA